MESDSEGGRFWALAGWGFPRAVTGSTIYVLVLFWQWVTSPSAQVLLIYMGRIQLLCEKNQTLNGQVTLWDAGSPEQPVSGTASIPQQGLALPNVYTPQSNPGYPRQCVSGALSWSPAYGPLPNEQLPSLSPLSSRPPAQNILWPAHYLGPTILQAPAGVLSPPFGHPASASQLTVIITEHTHGVHASSLKFTKYWNTRFSYFTWQQNGIWITMRLFIVFIYPT